MMDEATCLKYSTWREGDGECQTDILNSVVPFSQKVIIEIRCVVLDLEETLLLGLL